MRRLARAILLSVPLIVRATAHPLAAISDGDAADAVTTNVTHMSPLITYTGDVSYMHDSHGGFAGSHHELRDGAELAFTYTGEAFIIDGWWADARAAIHVWEELDEDSDDKSGAVHAVSAPAEARVRPTPDSPETLVAVLGVTGLHHVRMRVVRGTVWVSSVATRTEVVYEWSAPYWPVMDRLDGARDVVYASNAGRWTDEYLDLGGNEDQPVAWAHFASVTLRPRRGTTFLQLMGATPRNSPGHYRVTIDPPMPGFDESWRTIAPDTQSHAPAAVLIHAWPLDPSQEHTITLEGDGFAWSGLTAALVPGDTDLPHADWAFRRRLRRAKNTVVERIGLVLGLLIAMVGALAAYVIVRRRKEALADDERRPLLH